MDLDGILVGTVIGFIAGALILTATGREVSKAVGHRGRRYASKAGKYAAKRIRGDD